jgi:hypothetical protein
VTLHPRLTGDLHIQSAYGLPTDALGTKWDDGEQEMVPLLYQCRLILFDEKDKPIAEKTSEG